MLRYLSILLLTACAAAPAVEPPPPPAALSPEAAAVEAYLDLVLAPKKPVTLAAADLLGQGLLGETQNYPDHYAISIDASLGGMEQQMVLIHEWAHILVWEDNQIVLAPQHGPEWGVKYSIVFRVWAGELVE